MHFCVAMAIDRHSQQDRTLQPLTSQLLDVQPATFLLSYYYLEFATEPPTNIEIRVQRPMLSYDRYDYEDNEVSTTSTQQLLQTWKEDGLWGVLIGVVFRDDPRKGNLAERFIDWLLGQAQPYIEKFVKNHGKLYHLSWIVAIISYCLKYIYTNREAIWKWLMLRALASVGVQRFDTGLHPQIMAYVRSRAL